MTGGQFGDPGTNYSAGNPRWDRLRMNGEKFKLAFGRTERAETGAFPSPGELPYVFGNPAQDVSAAYSTGELSIGAVDIFKTLANGRKRNVPFFQVAGVVAGSKTAVIAGNYAPGTSAEIPSLVRDPDSANPSLPLAERRVSVTIV